MDYNDDIIYPMINWTSWRPLHRCVKSKAEEEGELCDVLDMSTRIIVEEEEPLNDIEEPAFEPRDVTIRQDVWVTQEFEILDFLGRGKFGEVKRCRESTTEREFAAKFICSPRPQDKKDVAHEVEIMKKLQHKRLIQLYDAFENKSEMCLVLEIIYGGELFDRVISDDFVLTEKACQCFARQICEGVDYMHEQNIIHLDMKPENILCLTKTGNRIKIIDFGLAREYDPGKDLRVLFGTPEFMAPEVVQYDPINFATDLWSIGVICYVLLSGLSPFMGDNDGETLTNVIKGQYDFCYAEFEEVSDEAKDMIAKLLVRDKNQRLTAKQCLEHPWLNSDASFTLEQAVPPLSPSLNLSKQRLKRFVYRRKWQKIVNAIIALKRMGVTLMTLRRSSIDTVRPPEPITRWENSPPKSPRSPLKPTEGATNVFDYNAKMVPSSPKLQAHSSVSSPKGEKDENTAPNISTKVSSVTNQPKSNRSNPKLSKSKPPEVNIIEPEKDGDKHAIGENEIGNGTCDDNKLNRVPKFRANAKRSSPSPKRAGKNSPLITPEVERRSSKLEEKSTKDSGIMMDDFDQIQHDLDQIQSDISHMEVTIKEVGDHESSDICVNGEVDAPPPIAQKPDKKPDFHSSACASSSSSPKDSSGPKASKDKEKEASITGTLRRKKQGLQNHMRALVSRFESR